MDRPNARIKLGGPLHKLRALARLGLLGAVWLLPGTLVPETVTEYGLKAAYLFNFAKFVEWPEGAFDNEEAPLQIGILGEDPFGEELDRVVSGKSVGKHPIKVRRFGPFSKASPPDLRRCQVLFVAYSEKGKVREVLAALSGAGVLTVSEIERFHILGGMISFDQVGKKIALVINPAAAQHAGLLVSARLLQVARVYKGDRP